MQLFENFEQKDIWTYFEEIMTIPRPSDQEEKIKEYLIKFAETHTLEYQSDKTGNILIRKAGTAGMMEKPIVILQSHMDMVCEKNADVEMDFLNDPIPAFIDGDWVKSKGTTLGADDGIGMAAQLAILASENIPHGPLECLFTVAEETGLTGAFGLQPGFLKGRLLLNLDSEDEGEIFIGCAGGIDVSAWFDYEKDPVPANHTSIKLSVSGLKGGHSGDEIQKGLGNSIKILTRFLWENTDELGILIHRFEGGNLRNAIPREAFAEILVPAENIELLKKGFDDFFKDLKIEFPVTEPSLKLSLQTINTPEFVLDEDTQVNLLNALYACPHGVLAWSQTMENIVETSTNLAAIKFENNRIAVTTLQRSSLESAKKDMANMVEAVFLLAGAETSRDNEYPGWNPNPDSPLVKLSSDLYEEMFDEKPVVRAIHAGLECGLFLEKNPDLDMISFGPTIKGAHSPDERLNIPTTLKFYKYLKELLIRV